MNINLPSTAIMVTEQCTLRCKLCLAYIPYYSSYDSMNLEHAQSMLNTYFLMIGTVNKISLTGGEPLLNKDLPAIIRELYKYEHQILDEIILITNGTIRIGEELLEVLESNKKIKVIVNNYGEMSRFAHLNHEMLQEHYIKCILYDESNRYGWIDCRDHSLKHITEEKKEMQAKGCAFFQGKKYVIKRGKLYTCTRAAYRMQENIIPFNESDYVDLLDNTDIQIKKEKLMHLFNLKYTASCPYCDGLLENSVKYKAAEQL